MQHAITKFRPPWLEGLAIKASEEPFEVLPRINELVSLDDAEQVSRGAYLVTDRLEVPFATDSSPIPLTKDREFYNGDQHAAYWASGYADFAKTRSACQRHGVDVLRYFELGCSSGRVLRHWANSTSAEIVGCDLNARHAEWCRLFLPKRIVTFQNTALPSLPLEQNYFDAIAAFSVFTHIDDMEIAWLLEMRRILRPGGIAYLTVSSEQTWANHRQGWIKSTFSPLADQITEYKVDDAFFASPTLPAPKTVLWWQANGGVYNSSVFHTMDYIESVWGRIFDIVEVIPSGHTYQDVIVLRKR